MQKRAVWCINEESGEEEKISLCAKHNKPDSVQNCNPKECKTDLGKRDYIILYSVCFSGPNMYLDTLEFLNVVAFDKNTFKYEYILVCIHIEYEYDVDALSPFCSSLHR